MNNTRTAHNCKTCARMLIDDKRCLATPACEIADLRTQLQEAQGGRDKFEDAYCSSALREVKFEAERDAAIEDAAEQRALADARGEALKPFARHFIPSGGTTPGRLAKLDEAEPWTLADFGRASALAPAEAQDVD